MRNKMNCEQKYKEALKVMEGLYNIVRYQSSSDALLTSQTIEKAFPELKESEDERIRKQILSFLKEFEYDHYRSLDFSSWIAWLEKQKKSDALINTTSEMEYAKNYSYDVWEKLMSKFNAIAGYRIGCNDVSDIVLNAILNAFEWQNKQKPIEQDTETHDLWVYIREWNDKFGRLPKDEDELAACIDYVMKRQKPADDYCQKNCKGYRDTGGRCFADGECEAKKKAEQKPTWSEEDERHRKRIVERLEDIRKSKEDNIDVASVILSEINWLKSFKPNHWKPSEEQLNALKQCIGGYYSEEADKKT